MNAPRPPLLVRVAEAWVAWYTRGLPSEVRDARRAELRSDLFEHRRHAAANGHGRLRWSIQVGGRVVRGMPDDLWWRFAQQTAGRPATEAAARRRQLLAWLFDWVVSPAFAVGMLLVGARAYGSTLRPWQGQVSLVRLAALLASVGVFVSVLMLANEYARRWRRRRRRPASP